MRRKTLERLEPEWEKLSEDTVPVAYPSVSACVVRGQGVPTLMPTLLRFVRVDDATGARPVTPDLEAAFVSWFNSAVLLNQNNEASAVAHLMARDLADGSAVVAGVAGGSCVRQFTHYSGWKPDHSWRRSSEWGTRLELPYAGDGGSTYGRMLDEVGAWVSTVPDPLAAYRSVLVACPDDDLIAGRWWRYADGSRGTPMPIFDMGTPNDAEEFFRVSGGGDARAPILRELEVARSHVFAVRGGPAGFLQIADAVAVTRSSEFLDQLDESWLTGQEEILEAEDWADAEAAVARVRTMTPLLRRFYDRASQHGFSIVNFGYVDELPVLPETVSFRA